MVLWHAVPLWAARLLRHILTARSALAAGQAWPDPYSAHARVPLQRDRDGVGARPSFEQERRSHVLAKAARPKGEGQDGPSLPRPPSIMPTPSQGARQA